MAIYIRSSFNATRCTRFECGCHEIMIVKVCSRFNNFYIFSIYRNPDLDDVIYDCLLNSMAAIQEMDVKSSFIFVGDLNAHHREWLGSISATDAHGQAALNFNNLSGCEQLVRHSTHSSGNCLDLLLTDVPALVDVTVVPPFGTSDHSALSFKIQNSFSVPDVTISRKVFLKSRADWNGVNSDMTGLIWKDVFGAESPIEALNKKLLEISERRIPTRTIRSRLRDKVWFNDDCRRAQRNKQEAYRAWSRRRSNENWIEYVRLRGVAQRVYSVAQNNHNNHLKDILSGTTQPHSWWSALKQSLFGVDSSIPPISRSDGSICHDSVEKANILAQVFDGKQSTDEVNLPSSCFPKVLLRSCAFRSTELRTYLDDLDSYGGVDPQGFLPVFFKHISKVLAPKLAVLFRSLLRSGSFPPCWRLANVTPIPKGSSPTSNPSEYRPISITPILSKVFERLISRRIYRFVEDLNLLPRNQFGFRKGLSTMDALLYLTHDSQSALDSGHESRLVSLDFSSAFDRVNHKALLYKVRSLGIGGPLLNILSDFLSHRRQRVSVDGCFSQFTVMRSGVPQGSVLGPLLFIIYTSDMWNDIESDMVSYADDTTLSVVIRSPAQRPKISDKICRDILTDIP